MLAAAALILMISVHGLVGHEHGNAENVGCILCEVGDGFYSIEIPEFSFLPTSRVAQSVFLLLDERIQLEKTFTYPLRGPPLVVFS